MTLWINSTVKQWMHIGLRWPCHLHVYTIKKLRTQNGILRDLITYRKLSEWAHSPTTPCSLSVEDGPVRVAIRWPQHSMCSVPRSTCTTRNSINSMHKMRNFTILNCTFTIKMRGESRFNLTDGHLCLWSFVPSSQKWIRLSKLPSYFNFKIPSFAQFSMAVAYCCNSNIPVVYAMHDGQDLKHPSQLDKHPGINTEPI